MASGQRLSCGRDLCCVPDIKVGLEDVLKNGYVLCLASMQNIVLGVFCGLLIAECGKFSRGNLRKIRCGFFFCGVKGKVRNESMRNVTEMNIY